MPRPPRPWPSIHRQTKAAAATENAEHHAVLPTRLSFDIQAAVANTGLTENFIRTAVWEQRLPARMCGQKYVILRSDLLRFIESLPVCVNRIHRKGR
jgi:hypothetical protein